MIAPRASVVIPAHNESAVIGRLLDGLSTGITSGALEVVVVPNGCTDDTATQAMRPGVIVVELAGGSKPSALNAGDAAATAFPRFYVDADIEITAADIDALADALDAPGVDAVAPRLELDGSHSSWLVRSYHRIWQQLPSVVDSLAGRGCIGVSASGRARWEQFPALTADDQFVNLQFGPGERIVVDSVHSRVHLPHDVGSLVARKRRADRGNFEISAEVDQRVMDRTAWLGVVRDNPALAIHAVPFVAITVVARALGALDRKRGVRRWDTDRSSR